MYLGNTPAVDWNVVIRALFWRLDIPGQALEPASDGIVFICISLCPSFLPWVNEEELGLGN